MRTAKITLVLVVACLLAVSYRLGILHEFADLARAKDTLVHLGPRGYAAFFAAFAVLQPFGVPGTIFVMVAPLIWPWPVAFGLSMAGTMAASVIGFSFARFVARDWVIATIPARFRAYDTAVARRPFLTVFLLRLVFWMPQWLHSLLGVSEVSFGTHFWASLAGYAIPLFLVSYFGQELFDALRGVSMATWLVVGAGIVALWGGYLVWRRRQMRIAR